MTGIRDLTEISKFCAVIPVMVGGAVCAFGAVAGAGIMANGLINQDNASINLGLNMAVKSSSILATGWVLATMAKDVKKLRHRFKNRSLQKAVPA